MRNLAVVLLAMSLLTGCSSWPRMKILDGEFYYSPFPIGFEWGGGNSGAGSGTAPDVARPAQ